MENGSRPNQNQDNDQSRHVVDELIEDRAPHLIHTPFWALIKWLGYPLLGYKRAVKMVDAIFSLTGTGCLDWMSDYLDLRTYVSGLDNIPESGACVIVANHPGGIADGIALWDSIKHRREDVIFFANHDGLKVCPGLQERIIPVAWRDEERTRAKTRETLTRAREAFKAGQCVVIFPAGRMAEWSWKNWRLTEKPWQPTAISLARKYKAPIIPLAVNQRMPFLYYLLAQFSEELKDMTVFQGLIGKKTARYRLDYGRAMDPQKQGSNDIAMTDMLRDICERTAWAK